MSILNILNDIQAGSLLSVVIVILALVEVTPIKVSPLKWVGNRVNAELIEKITKTEKKLDEHVAESYRNNIFMVQDKLLKGEKMPMEEWRKALKVCKLYEEYVTENHLTNGEADEAIKLIHRRYQTTLNKNDFLVLPNN